MRVTRVHSAKLGYGLLNVDRGGASGCVVAARLAQCPGVKVLLIEAGSNCEDLEDYQMAGG